MSSTDRGSQDVTFDFKNPLQGKEFNKLLRGVLKHGIYQGGAVSITSDGAVAPGTNNAITIQPFQTVFNSGTDKLVNVATSASLQLTCNDTSGPQSASDTLLVMRYVWDDVIQNYIDFEYQDETLYTPLDTDVVVCKIVYGVYPAISSLVTTGRTSGLFDDDYNLVVENTLYTDIIKERTLNAGINMGSSAFFVDQANKRVGINDASPSYSIDVDGTGRITGAVILDTTLGVTGITTLTGLLNANGGIAVDTSNFTVNGTTGAVYTASTLGVTGVLTANGGAVFNENSADVDFRVESDTNTHAFFVQGSDGNVGIGTSSPAGYLSSPNFAVYDSSHCGITIATGSGSAQTALYFADGTTGTEYYEGYIIYDHNVNGMIIGVNHANRITINSSGNVGIGVTPEAWGGSIPVALDIGGGGSISAESTEGFYMSNNAYFDITNSRWEYKGAYKACNYYQYQGRHVFRVTNTTGSADGAITWTEAMRIDASGNVGIGATPVSGNNLDIYDATHSKIVVRATSGNDASIELNEVGGEFGVAGTNGYRIIDDGGTNLIYFQAGSGASITDIMVHDRATGNVGIGVTPTNKLDVAVNTGNSVTSTTTVGIATGNSYGTDAAKKYLNLDFIGYDDSTGDSNGVKAQIGSVERTGSSRVGLLTFSVTDGSGNLNESMRIDSSGKIATGGESSPDVDAGGLCLNHGSGDSNVLTLKNSDVAQGMTDVAQADTYAYISKFSDTLGGLLVGGLSESASSVGISLNGYAGSVNTTIGTSATAPIELNSYKQSGTNVAALGSTENILTVTTAGTARLIVQGAGHLYTDAASSSGGTGNYAPRYYDDEDDIMLAEAARYAIGNKEWKNDIMEKYGERLEELGIMKNGFMWHQGIDALNLGAVGQLWNMIRNVTKELGYTEQQLLEMSKDYS